MATVFIAIGTNLGNRQENLKTAISRLADEKIATIKLSRIYETAPMYEEDQPRFLNMAGTFETELSYREVLTTLKHLEQDIGRTPSFRNGPRLIDLDILYYNDLLVDEDDLKIPHISISERQFVLQPLLDINPDWVDIRANKTVQEMADNTPSDPTLNPILDSLD